MSPVPTQFEVPSGRYYIPLCFHIDLASITATGDVITNIVPGFPGTIVKWFWVQDVVGAGVGAAISLNLEIGAVDVQTTPGVNATIPLTLATATPQGVVIAGTTPNYSNRFDKDDTLSLEATVTVAFTAGDGTLVIIVESKIM